MAFLRKRLGGVSPWTWLLFELTVLSSMAIAATPNSVTLSVASSTGMVGGTVNLDVTLHATTSLPPVSLQWTIGYSASDFSSLQVVAGAAATAAGKSVSCNPGFGGLSCVVYGLNTTPIANGVVATIQATISPTTANASTAISLSQGVASSANGTAITPVVTQGGSLSIQRATTTVNITVTSNPSGMQIVVDGVTYTAPQSFQWVPGSTHTLGAPSPQGAGPTRYVWASWSHGASQTNTITTPTSPRVYTAGFTTQYQLTTGSHPGSGGRVTPTAGYYDAGATVQLTATPNPGYRFAGWSADGAGVANPLTVTMNQPRSYVAIFTEAAQEMTITTSPSGLQIVVDGTTYTAPQTFQWTPGSTHTIAAAPVQGSGGIRHQFVSWSHGGASSQTISTPTVPTVYVARYQTFYLLSTQVVPSLAGRVLASPSSPDGFYPADSVVQLTPEPAEGYRFASWSGGVSGSERPVAITMSGPITVHARFNLSSECEYTLSRSTFSLFSEGDLGRLMVTTNTGCTWSASSSVSWLQITAGAHGSGNGIVRFLAAPNPSPTARSGELMVAGQRVAVSQAGSGCGSSVQVSNFSLLPTNGGVSTWNVTAPSSCEWTASLAPPSWLTMISGGATSRGVAAVSARALPNSDPVPRTGSIMAGGTMVQLIQSGKDPVRQFRDVPVLSPFFDYVLLLRLYGITSGCNATDFCPDTPITQGEMAVFVVRALMGGDVFPYVATPYFTDVPPTHPFFPHIQKIRELGIATGCSATQYCPNAFVTRTDMATYLIRARFGLTALQSFPTPSVPFFSDVEPAHPGFPFIQKLRQLGITAGCTSTQYCPSMLTTRGQMAVFLVRTFFTP